MKEESQQKMLQLKAEGRCEWKIEGKVTEINIILNKRGVLKMTSILLLSKQYCRMFRKNAFLGDVDVETRCFYIYFFYKYIL